MLSYPCTKCGELLQSPDSLIGAMETCPACGQRMRVPTPEAIAHQDQQEQLKEQKEKECEENRQPEKEGERQVPVRFSMKLAASLIICAMLVVTWVTNSAHMTIVVGSFFLLGELVDLIFAFRAALLYRAGRHEEWNTKRSGTQKLGYAIWRWLAVVGLISMGAGGLSGNLAMAATGGILWFGSVVFYLISGIIADVVAGIPLRMTYAGWQVRRPRARRSRYQ